MKKIVIAALIATFAAAGLQNARAGDHEWAVVGKVLTGVAVAGVVAGAIDHVLCDVHYGYAPVCAPPAVVYAPPPAPVCFPAPPPVVCAPPVVVAPAPATVVIYRHPVVVYRHPVIVRRVVWRARW